MIALCPLAYSAEYWNSPAYKQGEQALPGFYSLLNAHNFDGFKNSLDGTDKAILKTIARPLCENALFLQKDDRFILALLEREADLEISIEAWADMILNLSSDHMRKKLVINKHSQRTAIKSKVLDIETERLRAQCAYYDDEDRSAILKKIEMKLAVEDAALDDQGITSKVGHFFKANRVVVTSIAAGSLIALIIWKLKSPKKDIQNNDQID